MVTQKTSKLADIYRSEKTRGGGVVSTLGKAALEKIDPRQFFNQKGFLAAVLPSLFKAYKAPTGSEKISTLPSMSFSSMSLENKVDILIESNIFKLYYDNELKVFEKWDDMKEFIFEKISSLNISLIFSYSPNEI